MRILHVTECFDGGVSRAIQTMVRNSPQFEHALLFCGNEIPTSSLFETVCELPDGIVKRIHAIKEFVGSWRADIVHGHSSWAGVYTRIRDLPVPVVYEPHCFVFDDPARSKLMRTGYWIAESLLSNRSSRIVTLTPHERRLARRLNPRVRTSDLVNVASVSVEEHEKASGLGTTITMIGRLAPQKDPLFFAAVARGVRQIFPEAQFVWIGDGDTNFRRELESEGVEVTGWLHADGVAQRLQESRIYLHSASYEGFPLSVLDAAEVRVPIIVRDLPCFEGFNLKKVKSVEEAKEFVVASWLDLDELQKTRQASDQLARSMHPSVQAQQLDHLYRSVHFDADRVHNRYS